MKYLFVIFLLLGFAASAQKINTDELKFRQAWKRLRTAVKSRDLDAARQCMHFPFYTAKSSGTSGGELPTDLIAASDFQTYKSDIFNPEVVRILPKLGEESLSEIEGNEDPYYAALGKLIVPGSRLYEIYAEYKQPGRNTESYFAFVFGRIKTEGYKVISYYGKWPVK